MAGYSFDDEINPDSELYQTGYEKALWLWLCWPNTQGSQFFIMVANCPLPLYTIFGRVISGQDVADKISLVDRDMNDKPYEDIIVKTIIHD